MQRDVILQAIALERLRQDDKWGNQAPGERQKFIWSGWLPILIEEVGEVAEAILDWGFKDGELEHIQDELIQVAAVAVAWLETYNNN